MIRTILTILIVFMMAFTAEAEQQDWANYGRYAADNASLAVAPDVVFMGNSITDHWNGYHPEFFADNNFACRGISGQVTSQMLCRFRADVIDLHPKAVAILAGTNDIAMNNGSITIRHIADNIVSMVELARAAGITPLICSVLPADSYPWRRDVGDVASKIKELNDLLRAYADAHGVAYVDYYAALATVDGALDRRFTDDGVHPTRAGYDVMEPIVLAAISKALNVATE